MNVKVSLIVIIVFAGQACSPSHVIGRYAQKELMQQPGLTSAQVGISLYDPVAARFLYNWQDDKYFIPASNTKLFSLYAGLKYLGDSLPGILYKDTDTALFVAPAGDPSLLHPDYSQQPVIDFLKKEKKPVYFIGSSWKENAMGRGWAWDDYNDDYMPERSPLPVYGNLIRWIEEGKKADNKDAQFDASPSFYSIPDVDWEVRFTTDTAKKAFFVQREYHKNVFLITEGKERYKEQDVPFITDGMASALLLLKDTVGKALYMASSDGQGPGGLRPGLSPGIPPGWQVIHSRPVDSLYRPMMYRSDNFFAEQTLLMVSRQRLGIMNDARIIDTLLNSDLKDLPQRPVWVDGCGLSRNDLFTPRDFVWLLDKMKNEFGLPRMERILPTGGTGTLAKYYKQDSGYIFAKTGSLSGVVALSGYLVTKKDHLLLFSILVNNENDPALRRKIEGFIHLIRDKY